MSKLPVLIVNNNVLLPHTIKEISINENIDFNIIKESIEKHSNQLLLVPKNNIFKSKGNNKNDILGYGVLARIVKILDNKKTKIIVEGIKRISITKFIKNNKGIEIADYFISKETQGSKKIIGEIRAILNAFVYSEKIMKKINLSVSEKNSFNLLEDKVFIERLVNILPFFTNEQLSMLLKIDNLEQRYVYVVELISDINKKNNFEDNSYEVKNSINNKVKEKVSKQQKEFYLREQLKIIQEELNDINGIENEFEEYRKRILENPYPKHIEKKLYSEIKKLESTPQQAQEANITRTYIEWLLDLPYWQKDEEIIDISKAKKILDKEHYGLKKPKDKIIEFLAVKQQNPNSKGSILALVGPPGTGKTTMAKSIANSLNRKLIKISLGGVKDEAEIRGHRRTYIAAMPGKIIQSMKKAGVNNPIILLDEIDKMSSDYKGDPTSAMLEVLDYEQNSMFQDHYLEEEYDLSNVTFIATANYIQNIPEPLIDRLDFIEVSSYTELEKINIFKKHLLKRIKNETKIPASLFKWNDGAIKEIIRHYTIEAGVRQLQREANSIARKILVKRLNGEIKDSLVITPKFINELLGPQKFNYTKIDKKPQIGTVTGLAWTQYGGDILPIEVSIYSGKADIQLTGLLKEVMRESSNIALSYIKANFKKFGITKDKITSLKDMDIHIHSPDGATPKDGPSAGVTFTTAIISAIINKPVSQYIGMTGEISLRGHILPIGGLKEKSISAFRSGLKTIFIPKENIKDLNDIPKEVRNKLKIIPVENYEEIFQQVFN